MRVVQPDAGVEDAHPDALPLEAGGPELRRPRDGRHRVGRQQPPQLPGVQTRRQPVAVVVEAEGRPRLQPARCAGCTVLGFASPRTLERVPDEGASQARVATWWPEASGTGEVHVTGFRACQDLAETRLCSSRVEPTQTCRAASVSCRRPPPMSAAGREPCPVGSGSSGVDGPSPSQASARVSCLSGCTSRTPGTRSSRACAMHACVCEVIATGQMSTSRGAAVRR